MMAERLGGPLGGLCPDGLPIEDLKTTDQGQTLWQLLLEISAIKISDKSDKKLF